MEYLFYRSPINLQSVFPVINHRLRIAWGKIYKICSSCLVRWVIFMSCGLNLATVILEEFPAICIQLNFLTDLGLLVNTGIWQKQYLCSSGAYSKTVNMVLAMCWVREDPGDEKGINFPLPPNSWWFVWEGERTMSAWACGRVFLQLSWYFIAHSLVGCWSYCLLLTTYVGNRLSSQNITVNSWGISLHSPKQIRSWFTTSSNLCFGCWFCIQTVNISICRFLEITVPPGLLGWRGCSSLTLRHHCSVRKFQVISSS